MHNKAIVLLVVLLSFCMLLMTGCNKNKLEVEQVSNQSTQPTEASKESPVSPTPSEELAQQTTTPSSEPPNNDDAEFYIEEDKIYKKSSDEVTLFYDPTNYYDPDTSSAINTLIIDEEALFFKEWNGGAVYEDGFSCHSIVRLDKDGNNRQALVSSITPFGYSDLISFQNRLIYLEECGDSYSIKDVSKDGSNENILEFNAYSVSYNSYPSYVHVYFYNENGYLYVELSMYTKDGTYIMHTVRIDNDFSIERVLPQQDEYFYGGSIIYLNQAHSDKMINIYDANLYSNKEIANVRQLLVTDDALYFTENGFNQNLNRNVSSIIRTDKSGNNRQIVYTPGFYCIIQPIFCYGKVFFVEDNRKIGCVEDNGSLIRYLYIEEYAKKHGLDDANINSVWLSIEEDELIATINYDHELKINEDLSYEQIE